MTQTDRARLEPVSTMIVCAVFTLILACVSALGQSDLYNDEFHEELVLKQLPSGHVYSYFQFTTLWENGGDQPSKLLI